MTAALPIEGASPSAGNPIETPRVAYAECNCGRTEAFDRSAGLPAGWRELAANLAACPDCAALGQVDQVQPRGELVAGLPGDERDPPLFLELPPLAAGEQLALIPHDAAKGGHHGCRLIHNIVAPNAVILRIHAGARPVDPIADRPVLFLARRADVRELIEALEAIDASLAAAEAAQSKGN